MSEIFGFPSRYDERILNIITDLLEILVKKNILTEDDIEKMIKNLKEYKK